MKALSVEPGKPPVPVDIENGLEPLQRAVGGYIEAVYPFDDPVGLICNEEGKILGLPPNRALYLDDGSSVYDIVCGNFLVVGLGDDDFCDLNEEMLQKYEKQFEKPERFYLDGHGTICAEKTEAYPVYHMNHMALLKAAITNEEEYKAGNLRFRWVSLPIPENDLKLVLREVGSPVDAPTVFCSDVDCDIPGLSELFYDHVSPDTLNTFGTMLESLSSLEVEKYKCLVAMERPVSVTEAMNLCANLDCWNFLPNILSESDLGKWCTTHEKDLPEGCSGLEKNIPKLGKTYLEHTKGSFQPYGYLYKNEKEPKELFVEPVEKKAPLRGVER